MTMRSMRRNLLLAAVAALLMAGACGRAAAQSEQNAAKISDGIVKIGLILDMSGPYSATTGIASATAARMAVEDFGGKVLGAPIEVVVADHENSSSLALRIARDWFDNQHVDAIMDVSGSSTALNVQAIGNIRDKIVLLNAAAAERLTSDACTPVSILYVFNTRAIANTVAAALVARGDNTWFFITVDYSFGYDLVGDTSTVVQESGGRVLGDARHPLDTADFTSYLARARESQAKVIGLANAGGDLENTIKTAARLGMIPGPQEFAGLAMRISAVDRLGLATTQGMMLSEPFYWDLNDETRAWSKRYFDRVKKMPNSLQAGVYSSTTHYLRAVASAGTDATVPVMQAMRAAPINDFFVHDGRIRPDGVMVHDMYLFQVKSPAESHYPWDYLKLIATIPGEKAFGSLEHSKCPLVMPESGQ
jgi:branched-chain amino acid transport system substrate-binding protein